MRGLGNCSIKGDRTMPGLNTDVALITLNDRIDSIKDGDVHNGHRAAGAAGAKLFAEYSSFTGPDGCVIESAGVDRDLVPAMNRIKTQFWPARLRDKRSGVEEWAKSFVMILGGSLRQRRNSSSQAE